MKRLFSWLFRRPVLSFIGVVLLSLIVWFEGPLVSFNGVFPFASSSLRWTLIWLMLLAWAAYFGWKMLKAWLANRRLMKNLAGEEAAPAAGAAVGHEAAAETALLAKRLQEAMAVLRKAKLGSAGSGGGNLYRLPWYMFVGAPGSGKTTALVHSGLKFPLADTLGKGAVSGVGGTRNCDWWFTDEAVLLDTAGRYTTQDSYGEVDAAAWQGFLQLLRRQRGRRPVNGIIVAVSVADLLQQSDAARRTQALAVRARIKELHEQLGIVFPVYVVVTKGDLLAGFIEYFDNLGREERGQVWGMTFPLAGPEARGAGLSLFGGEFAALQEQLQARLFARMQQERDVQRRALIYNFPQQFAALGEALQTYLNDAFDATAYEEAALLRGVYFTSGTQEGSPIDRVMGSLAASFGLDRKVLPPNVFGGRSYFITRLLREVIFKESGLAGTNLRLERNRRLLQWGGIALTAIVLVLGTLALAGSYARNRAYVNDVAARSEQIDKLARALPPGRGSVLVTLPLLNALRDIPGGYRERGKGAPFMMGFGLYQGDKLGEGATRAYQRFLRETLMPRLLERMETELRRGSANSADYLYELLRVYLMLGDRSHLDAEAVAAWVDYDMARNLPQASEADRQDVGGHVAALLDPSNQDDAPPQLDANLIAQTRLTLAKMPMGDRVYHRLKRELLRDRPADFDVAAAAGRDAAQVLTRQSGQPLTRGVSGAYTPAGYKLFMARIDVAIADIVKDGWVLDRREAVDSLAGAAQMKASVQQLYYDDYIRAWDALLADVVVQPFEDLDQAARILNSLSGSESPMRKFLQAAAQQTTLDKLKILKSGVDLANDKMKQLGDAAKKRLEAALGEADEARPADAKPVNPVDAHFDALHKMVASGGAGGSSLDALLQKLREVALYFDAAGAARAAGQPAPPPDALNKLKREGDNLPAPLAAMLLQVSSGAAGLTEDSERGRLNALWVAGPAGFCRRAIAGRYPLLRSAGEDATAEDFGRYFGPGGLVDEFFQKNLQNYVDMSGPQWHWRPVNNVALGIGQDVLNEFQRAALIRDRFFSPGGRQASMRFELRPLAIDPAVTRAVLEVDGQSLAYAPKTPVTPVSFQLPSGKGASLARLDTDPAPPAEFRAEGPWDWFRLMDRGVLEPTPQAERFKLTFDSGGRKLVYELTASSVNNPFRREALEQARCLEHL